MERTIILENLDHASATWLEQEAERLSVPVEQVVLTLIQQAIENAQLVAHHDLDHLAGTWSDEEADEFLRITSDFEQVDEKLWQ
jgi:hypothetical protein